MRLIVARCEVRYTGRLTALLPESTRLVMVKSDGSVPSTPTRAGTSRSTG
jgi:RecB family endonuclease NucS